MLYKQFAAVKIDTNATERTVTATISTGEVDRDNEVLVPKGGDFTNFLKNPVVLWAHNYYEPPIGKALWIKKVTDKIIAKMEFAETEKANEIYDLFKGGFLNAFSIGFAPVMAESSSPTPDEIKKNPELANARRVYRKWELLEFSPVPVPANPDALAMAVKSLDVSLSKDLLNDFQLVENEIEETFYPDTTASSDAQLISAVADSKTCTVTDNNGNVSVIDVELAIEKIFNITAIPVDIEPCIEVSGLINISAEMRKLKGVMYE